MGQFALEDLKLAFSLHVVDLIIAADDKIDLAELAFVEEHFPRSTLVARGFSSEDGVRSDAYHDAAMQALELLPDALSVPDKQALLQVFLGASVVDGSLALAEGSAVLDGARLLGLEDDKIQALLDSHAVAGGTRVEDFDSD